MNYDAVSLLVPTLSSCPQKTFRALSEIARVEGYHAASF